MEPDLPGVDITYVLTSGDVASAFQLHNRALLKLWPALLTAGIVLAILVDTAANMLPGDSVGAAVVLACGAFGGIALPLAVIRWVVPA